MSETSEHLRCTNCGAAWLSPVPRELYEAGGKCLACKGELILVKEPDDTQGSSEPPK